MWHPGGYSGVPVDSGDDCVQAKGLHHALCYAWRSDNTGPHSVEEVLDVFSRVRAAFPHATVTAAGAAPPRRRHPCCRCLALPTCGVLALLTTGPCPPSNAQAWTALWPTCWKPRRSWTFQLSRAKLGTPGRTASPATLPSSAVSAAGGCSFCCCRRRGCLPCFPSLAPRPPPSRSLICPPSLLLLPQSTARCCACGGRPRSGTTTPRFSASPASCSRCACLAVEGRLLGLAGARWRQRRLGSSSGHPLAAADAGMPAHRPLPRHRSSPSTRGAWTQSSTPQITAPGPTSTSSVD